MNDTTVVEVRTETAFYRTFPGKYAPRVADDVMDAISSVCLATTERSSERRDWSITDTKLAICPC